MVLPSLPVLASSQYWLSHLRWQLIHVNHSDLAAGQEAGQPACCSFRKGDGPACSKFVAGEVFKKESWGLFRV